MKKAKKVQARPVKPARVNRNRPLELRNQMSAMLVAMAAMSKLEAQRFTGVIQHLEDMSRSSRKRIIGALAQVYA